MVLHKDDSVQVEWEVVVGCGLVAGEGIPAQARGYVERLHMEGWPWRLGLSRLFWGRFCGNSHSVVWIVWEGRMNRSWCLLDGHQRTNLQVFLPDRIQADGLRLDILPQDGLVDDSIRSALWGLRLPGQAGRFLAGRERKWTGPATLSGDAEDTGHVIHEVVEWP